MPVINTTMLDQQGCHHAAVAVTIGGRQGAHTGHHSDQLGQSSQVYRCCKEIREAVWTGKSNCTELDWIEQCFTSPPTQYRLYGRRFLQVKRPNQQSTEGTNSTDKSNIQ